MQLYDMLKSTRLIPLADHMPPLGALQVHEPEPIPANPIRPSWTEITIKGDAGFVRNTQKALDIIHAGSQSGYELVKRYIAVIEQSSFTGMRAFDNPPTFQVGSATYNSSATWYASTIIHDAYHSKLYHEALERHGYVANDMWTGYDAEMLCLSVQIDFLKEIGAPQREIDHAISQRYANWWDGTVDW
jgi:hypothetical protein